MAEFTNVTSGFDIEALIDENALRHLAQIFFDAEPATIIDGLNLIKNFEDIERDFTLNYESATQGAEIMQMLTFPENDNHFYVLINPLNFDNLITIADSAVLSAVRDVYVVLRINRNQDLIAMIDAIQSYESDSIYSTYQNFFRVEGFFTKLHLEEGNNATEDDFRASILSTTSILVNNLKAAHEAGTLSIEMFDSPLIGGALEVLLSDLDNYETFLMAFHNLIGINEPLIDAFKETNTSSPLLMSRLVLEPYISQNKIGVYGNFNLIQNNTHGNVNNASVFASNERSGFAMSLTEDLVSDLFLAMIRFEMSKLLADETINQTRFNQIQYRYPFAVPSELIDELDLSGIDMFEINKVNLKFKKHKFAKGEDKKDALQLELVLSNDASGFFGDVLDFITPNPHVKVYLGLEREGGDLKLLYDTDVNIPFNFFTSLVLFPIIGVFGTALVFILGNIVVDAIVGSKLTGDEKIKLQFPVMKKRWDPFYFTQYFMRLDLSSVLINEEEQIRILADFSINKEVEPYTSLYVSEVEFRNDRIFDVTYKLNNVSEVLIENRPATDRLIDFYDLENLEREISLNFVSHLGNLTIRKNTNKLLLEIPYNPRFVKYEDSKITGIKVLSELRRKSIGNILTNIYLEEQRQSILDVFFDLLLILVPDYDISSITAEQLEDINAELEVLIRDTGSYEQYSDEGWENDLDDYLRAHDEEMLTVSPAELALLGMNSSSVQAAFKMAGLAVEEQFDFLEMKNYVAIAIGEDIFVRNLANSSRADNMSTLPEYE